MSVEDTEIILEKTDGNGGNLISILQDIQARHSYLPREALEMVAQKTGRSLVDIYGVATFYRAFSLEPRGKHLVSACLGTACHVRGGPLIAAELESQLGIRAGKTTPDREFTLVTVNCLGACALGPVVVVDGHYFPHVTVTKVRDILSKARAGLDKTELGSDQRVFPVEVSCSKCNHSLLNSHHLIDGHPSISVTISFDGFHGWLRLSSLYGSYNTESEYEAPEEGLVHFYCPHCSAEMIGALDCPECSVRMVPMIVKGGGIIQICPRRGCKGHLLDLG
jgi:NADH-quinone oxidoreductase subunit E